MDANDPTLPQGRDLDRSLAGALGFFYTNDYPLPVWHQSVDDQLRDVIPACQRLYPGWYLRMETNKDLCKAAWFQTDGTGYYVFTAKTLAPALGQANRALLHQPPVSVSSVALRKSPAKESTLGTPIPTRTTTMVGGHAEEAERLVQQKITTITDSMIENLHSRQDKSRELAVTAAEFVDSATKASGSGRRIYAAIAQAAAIASIALRTAPGERP